MWVRAFFQEDLIRVATDDSTVAPVRLSTATDDPATDDPVQKSCFGWRDGRKFQVRYNEVDVCFSHLERIATGQLVRFWSRLSSDVARLEWRVPQDICVKDPNAAKLEKHRGVYWLPCSATEHTDLCARSRCYTDAAGRE